MSVPSATRRSKARMRWGRVATATFLVGALVSIIPAGPANAGANRWTTNGPFGGYIRVVVVDPFHPQVLLAAAGNPHIFGSVVVLFRSNDGGASWSRVAAGPGGSVASVAFDPVTANRVYAATSAGVFSSADDGTHWTLAGTRVLLRLVPDPVRAGTVYGWTQQHVVKSTDGGATWEPASEGLPHQTAGGGGVTSLVVDPSAPQRVYAGWAAGKAFPDIDGLYRSVDGGGHWAHLSLPGDPSVNDIALNPQDPRTLYVGTPTGILKSTDGGASWEAMNAGLPAKPDVTGLRISASTPSVLYASVLARHVAAVKGGAAVFRSVNGARRWTGTGFVPAELVWFDIDPTDHATVYLGAWDGVYVTRNGGAAWTASDAGMVTAPVGSVAPVASDPQSVFIRAGLYASSRGSAEVFRTTDGGKTWQLRNRGLSLPGGGIFADPDDPSTLFSAGLGLQKTTDAGQTWKGVLGRDIITVAIDPSAHRTVYAASLAVFGSDPNMYKSTDGGAHWIIADRGLGKYPDHVLVDPTSPSRVFATARDAMGHTRLYRSANGGLRWSKVGTPPSNLTALAIAPTSPVTLYAGNDEGVFASTDGGHTWSATGDLGPRHDVSVVRVDPSDARTLYAGTHDGGVFRTTDGGDAWHPLNEGLWQLDVIDLGVSSDGSRLYAGTASGAFEYTYR